MKKLLLLVLVLVLASSVLVGCFGGGADLVIGGKDFTEQDILVYMLAELIEANTDLTVETRAYLGGTSVVAQALERGDLDIYVEYTGTALINLLNLDLVNDPQEVYDIVKAAYEAEGLTWLEPLGFNNTYALAMRADRADELGIETYSDLARHASELTLGSTQEFMERPDGYVGLQETYGMIFGDTRGMGAGLTYAAVRDGQADVNDAFATDGRIAAFGLKVLVDDKQFFPPYYAAPVVRQDTLEKHPELAEVLNRLANRLDDATMSDLNAQVDLEQRDARQVAIDWLRSEGLIE